MIKFRDGYAEVNVLNLFHVGVWKDKEFGIVQVDVCTHKQWLNAEVVDSVAEGGVRLYKNERYWQWLENVFIKTLN